jgi:hypothetical protein
MLKKDRDFLMFTALGFGLWWLIELRKPKDAWAAPSNTQLPGYQSMPGYTSPAPNIPVYSSGGSLTVNDLQDSSYSNSGGSF